MIRSLKQVALPQQAVGMHVGDVKRRVQGLRGGCDAEVNRRDLVLRSVDLARGDREKPGSHNDQSECDQCQTNRNPFFQGHDLLRSSDGRRRRPSCVVEVQRQCGQIGRTAVAPQGLPARSRLNCQCNCFAKAGRRLTANRLWANFGAGRYDLPVAPSSER
ncbi:MAG TPA: hypothetical protein VGO01_24855 [Bradyrhizobium sp.]|nr:hypothetical protein [Bradyrhizobium sp.]